MLPRTARGDRGRLFLTANVIVTSRWPAWRPVEGFSRIGLTGCDVKSNKLGRSGTVGRVAVARRDARPQPFLPDARALRQQKVALRKELADECQTRTKNDFLILSY